MVETLGHGLGVAVAKTGFLAATLCAIVVVGGGSRE
jgi:hypothetical protein